MAKTLDKRVALAVQHFWKTRLQQGTRQGRRSGQRDYGNRTLATGGKQLDGFNSLLGELLLEAGLPENSIFRVGREGVTLPGYFRPTKQWDLVVVVDGNLLAAIECKALCGPSFGNNYNNRIEEALGSATDLWTAFREGKFHGSPRPFVGYILVLEEAPASTRSVSVHEKHFTVFEEFHEASYCKRCEESLRRLIRERSYDATALIISNRETGEEGQFREPARDLTFRRFAKLMCSQVAGASEAIHKN